MSNAGIEGFESSLLLGQLEDGDEDSHIGEGNEDYVKPQDGKGNKEATYLVDPDILSCQFHNGHVFTVRVGNNGSSVVLKATFDEQYHWKCENERPEYNTSSKASHELWREDGSMSQGVADGHITIQSHCQEDA